MARLGRRVFAQGIGLIAGRWKEIPPEVSLVMAKWLQAQGCTAEEFIAGVSRAIAEDEFSPSAKRILDLARPTAPAEVRAGEVFARVLELRRYHVPHGLRLSLDEVRTTIGDAAARAVVSIGGASRLVSMTDDSRPFIERDFAQAFAAFDREQAARVAVDRFLPAGAGTLRLQSGGPQPLAQLALGAVRALSPSPENDE